MLSNLIKNSDRIIELLQKRKETTDIDAELERLLEGKPLQSETVSKNLFDRYNLPTFAEETMGNFFLYAGNNVCIPMPGRETQKSKWKTALKSLVPKGSNPTYISDYFCEFMKKFDWSNVPEKAYMMTTAVDAECLPETTNKTFEEQKKMGILMNPIEYAVLQVVNAEIGNKPLDIKGWTRFGASAGGNALRGYWDPDDGQLRFDRDRVVADVLAGVRWMGRVNN